MFLILGMDRLGIFFLRRLGFSFDSNTCWIRWQAPLVGGMLMAMVLYPLALAGFTPRLLMRVLATGFILVGITHFLSGARQIYLRGNSLPRLWVFLKSQQLNRKILLLVLLGMGVLALGPVTNADALDYHMGVAIALLNHGGMPYIPEWFIGRLAGNGEVLNAFAISVGAEQFGSLLQYVSLLGIVGIILHSWRDDKSTADKNQINRVNLIALAATSAPILIFLISSPKPQMWPIAMTTFAFTLLVSPSSEKLSKYGSLAIFGLICALVMTASQAKFNFILGGGVLGALALSRELALKRFVKPIFVGLILGLLIIGPPLSWKIFHYSANWLEVGFSPLPGHLPGTDQFLFLAKSAKDISTPLPFPLLMFIPASFGAITTLLGFGFLLIIALRPGKSRWIWIGIGAVGFMVIATALLAPPSSRMYLESYYWLLVILVLQPIRNSFDKYKSLSWILRGQAVFVAIFCWLGGFMLIPGALSLDWRSDVMKRSANGYDVMQWADSVLPANAVVLNGHRSMALLPRDGVAYDWSEFVDLKSPDATLYLSRLKERAVTHVLVIGAVNWSLPISNCYGKLFTGPGKGHLATRNPFNNGSYYDVWIYEFNSQKLPDCVQQNQ
jgi:hypothetical protein